MKAAVCNTMCKVAKGYQVTHYFSSFIQTEKETGMLDYYYLSPSLEKKIHCTGTEQVIYFEYCKNDRIPF